MLEISIPGYKKLTIKNLILDYNGTLACDGRLVSGVNQRLNILAEKLTIYVLTADTFGSVASEVKELPLELSILPKDNQDINKLEYIEGLGKQCCAAIGNGRNDMLMLKGAALGIAVYQGEGTAAQAMLSADVVCTSIQDALDLLINPMRLVATLRS